MNDLTWNSTKLFCPQCGKQTVVELPKVWEENAGNQHICFSCSMGFMYEGNYMDLTEEELKMIVQSIVNNL